MIKPFLALLIGVVALVLVMNIFRISIPVTTRTSSGEFAVTGEGKIDVTPDTAFVDVGINIANAATVEAAQKTINETNEKILAAMKGIGIDKADITTSNYSVYPMYDTPQRLTGYSGNVTISIKVRDTAKVPDVISSATNAGANTIQGVRFSIDDPNKIRQQAREKAIENAKQQAEQISKSLGLKLGKITNIMESGSGAPGPLFDAAAMRGFGGGGGGPVVESGTQTVTSVVTLYYEKK